MNPFPSPVSSEETQFVGPLMNHAASSSLLLVRGEGEGHATLPMDPHQKSCSHSIWNRYVRLVQRNRTRLLAWESILDRLLWLFPGQSSEGSAWRQVLWSCAELQHLAIDLALQQDTGDGMSLDTNSTTSATASSAALSRRIALTVLHNLWPVLYDALHAQPRRYRAYWQYQLERVRAICRLAISIPHYWRMYRTFPTVPPGILQRGGLVPSPSLHRPSAEVEAHRWARLNYVGRRTGRKVLQREGYDIDSSTTTATTTTSTGTLLLIRMLVGELLYTLRPLFWARAKYKNNRHNTQQQDDQLWKAWLVSLGLDVTSLVCLQQPDGSSGNPINHNRATAQEWKRRRLRLLLYLLRGPCHDRLMYPAISKAYEWLTCVPLLGNLLGAYLQDWLYYWKVYQLEE
eukprot:scaffold2655_cov179-Amphora_coffeaeformis.AAC.2